MRIFSVVLLGGLLMIATGCVSRSQYQNEVNDLQGQVAQLDAALKAEQARCQGLQAPAPKVQQVAAPAPYAGGLYRTSTGFEIPSVNIQKALKSAGYYSGGIDGKVGPEVREAIRNFQRDNGLSPDGVCGKKTWDKLKTYVKSAGG